MTREEAINNIKEHCYFANLIPQAKEALDMAIKALEQEPCDDCISRSATLDAIIKRLGIKNETYLLEAERVIYQQILAMPSVTPQPKVGRWFVDERPESNREIICSNCEKPVFRYHKIDFDYRPNYCPNCGAKMREVEE